MEELLKEIEEGIIVIKSKEIVFINKAAKIMLGFKEDEEVSIMNFKDNVINREIWQIFKCGEFCIEVSVPYYHVISVMQTKLDDTVVMTMRSVTKQVEAEEIKSDYIEATSYKLKSFLAPIKNVIEILLERQAGTISNPQEHLLRIANMSVDRLSYSISDLLDISRVKKIIAPTSFDSIEIKKIIEDAVSIMDGEAKKKNIAIECNIPEDLPKIEGDKSNLIRVFMNIIENGIHFTPTNGKISITAKVEKQYVKTSIKDTGYGIEESKLSKLFDEFYQTRRVWEEGVGLGLAVAKKLVDAHYGKIEVESEIGKGTTFHIFLPITQE